MTIDTLQPPVAARRPHSISHHGVTIEDPYFWLRNPSYPKVDDPAILAHLNAENAYFEAQMKPYAPLVEVLFREMKGRLKEDESSVPQKDGNFLYWRRFEKAEMMKSSWMKQRKPKAPNSFAWAKLQSQRMTG